MSSAPQLASGQRSQVFIGGPAQAQPTLLFETDELQIEAPNWSLDGKTLYVNGNGLLWAVDVSTPETGLRHIPYDGLPELNNDHVLDPDGEHIFLSGNDGHIYRAALSGGAVERVSPDDGMWHFLHGVSPDGKRLAYVELKDFSNPGRLAVLPLTGGSVSRPDTGTGHIDGPEWSPDGEWIYFNTEGFTSAPGHAQLARIHDTSGEVERLVTSETVDWFPHLSADNQSAAYISFPPGTLGHPPNLDVEVIVVSPQDWTTPLQRYRLFGGQGTINVNSWSPDSTHFAFVAYPTAHDGE
ncbi:PD40 domain-containing protein [Arthrobacter bambusae]|uniref:TolB family protein n=1 Tax=Arthrobacter bambusae TaxID=1338426 RepID=UPI001F5055E0|nr:biopolymer transporter Tol [Arthrobacter bambusae]MCI0144209.1 PD40 domain-containing protein [Arthrobacter bambusae]